MNPLKTVNMLRLYGYSQAGRRQRERNTSEASSSNVSASAAASNGDHPQQLNSGKSTPRSANGGRRFAAEVRAKIHRRNPPALSVAGTFEAKQKILVHPHECTSVERAKNMA